jgi:Copper type II ascorbate-dependent monooxygenase, C-terminal domain
VDNPQAIHHWLLYEEPTADGSLTMTIGQHGGGRLLAGWAPGGPPYDFRTYGDVGFELPATSYILEVHYNSSDANAEDASGVELCVQANKPQHVAGMSWLGYDQGAVLAATTGACIPADVWTGQCAPRHTEPIHLLFVTPHLHQTGTHLKAVINGPGGPRVLLDQPFDFNYQITYPTREVLMPGETITTTCNFSEPQCFGQATRAEMCYLFTYSYPKGALADGADWGALAHGEGTCLGQTTADIF